jgi:hypothetical protein
VRAVAAAPAALAGYGGGDEQPPADRFDHPGFFR